MKIFRPNWLRKLMDAVICIGLIFWGTNLCSRSIDLQIYGLPKALETEIYSCFKDLSIEKKELLLRDAFKRSEFLQEVKLFLEANGYYAATLHFSEADKVDSLQLNVSLGSPMRLVGIAFEVVGEPAQAKWLRALLEPRLPPLGGVLRHQEFDSFLEYVETTARAYGYFDGHWEVRRIELFPGAQAGRWSLRFNSGKRYRFGPVTVPQSIVLPRALEGLCPFREGEFYQEQLVTAYILSLYETQWFEVISFNKKLDPERAVIPIELLATPGLNHAVSCGIGLAHQEGLRFRLQYSCFRLNRFGHSLIATLNSQKRALIGANIAYRVPSFSNVNQCYYTIRYGLADQAYGTSPEQLFEQGLHLERCAQFSTSLFWCVGIHSFYEKLWTPFQQNAWLNYFSCKVNYVRSWQKEWIRALQCGWRLDGFPVAIGSAFPMARFRTDLRTNLRLTSRSQCDFRFVYQWIGVSDEHWDRIPPALRFYAGGRDSIRGYPLQSLGPVTYFEVDKKNYTTGGSKACVVSVEHHLHFLDNWRVSQFVDTGTLSHRNPKAAWHVGFGASIGYTFDLADLSIEAALPASRLGLRWSHVQWDFRLGKRL